MTKPTITPIYTADAPPPIGPYSQAVQLGNLIFTSGQIPLDEQGNLVGDGIEEQTHRVFHNLQQILITAGSSFGDVVKTTIFLKDMNQFSIVNGIYESYFGPHKPARSTIEVARLPKDVLVEIELIATKHVE